MKKASQHHEDAPRLVVAVPSITPIYALWNSETNELKRVYGGNLCENSVYVAGQMPKGFRMAAEDGSDGNELILSPLPNTIEEVVLNESPECQLVILNYTLIEKPEPKQKPGCKVIQHPAAPAALEVKKEKSFKKKNRRLARQAARNRDPHQFYMIFGPETPLARQA